MTTPTALIQAIKSKSFRTHPMNNDMAIYQSDLLPILEAYFVEPVTVDFPSLLVDLKKVGYITLQEEREGQSDREAIHDIGGG